MLLFILFIFMLGCLGFSLVFPLGRFLTLVSFFAVLFFPISPTIHIHIHLSIHYLSIYLQCQLFLKPLLQNTNAKYEMRNVNAVVLPLFYYYSYCHHLTPIPNPTSFNFHSFSLSIIFFCDFY